MVTETSLQFFVNAALEVAAILFLIIILVSCLMKKSSDRTRYDFCTYTATLICLLACNSVTWVLDAMMVSPSHLPRLYTLDLILTVFDFFFYCLSGIMILKYICTLVDIRLDRRIQKKRVVLIRILTANCVLTTVLFASSIFTEWFYVFAEDGYTYYTWAYWLVLLPLSNPAIGLAFAVIWKYRRLFGWRKALPLLGYLIFPIVFVILDQQFSLSVSYVSLAFNALIIYIGVDIEQDRELLAKEAAMARQEAEMQQMKTSLMISQIQPHFLYNTLGSIYYLCGKDAELARKTIKSFTRYLRTNVDSLGKSEMIPFEKELEHTKEYISIEMLRFSNVLQVEYDIRCSDFLIPALTLQPIVENAVKYGVRSREQGGTVTISARREGSQIIVSVHDDGMGFNPAQLPENDGEHIGIRNVRTRLSYMCSGILNVTSEIGVGTTADIILEAERNELTAD